MRAPLAGVDTCSRRRVKSCAGGICGSGDGCYYYACREKQAPNQTASLDYPARERHDRDRKDRRVVKIALCLLFLPVPERERFPQSAYLPPRRCVVVLSFAVKEIRSGENFVSTDSMYFSLPVRLNIQHLPLPSSPRFSTSFLFGLACLSCSCVSP